MAGLHIPAGEAEGVTGGSWGPRSVWSLGGPCAGAAWGPGVAGADPHSGTSVESPEAPETRSVRRPKSKGDTVGQKPRASTEDATQVHPLQPSIRAGQDKTDLPSF